jgi:hypothetical protein
MDEHATATLAFIALILMAGAAAYFSIRLQQRDAPKRQQKQAQADQLAIMLHPANQQHLAAERNHTIALARLALDREALDLKRADLALKYLALSAPKKTTTVIDEKPPGSVPSLFDLAEVFRASRPGPHGVFVARGATTGDIWVPPARLCHVLGGGNTGGGKTIIVRDFAMQLVSIENIKVYMYDPHAALVKRQPDGRVLDWRPIHPRLALGRAITDAREMCDLLEDMVNREMEERKRRERAYRAIGEAIFILVEELPILADESPEAISYLARLLKRSRQYLIFLICVSQNLLVKTTGLDSGDRSQYRTGLYTGGDDITAKIVLDLASIKEIDESVLGDVGVAYTRTAVSPLQVSRVGYASNAACYDLLGAPSIRLPDRPLSDREWQYVGEALREDALVSPLSSLTGERHFERRTGPLGESGESGESLFETALEAGESACESAGETLTGSHQKVRVSPEERKLILDAARAQLKQDPQRTRVAIQKLINEHNPPMNTRWWDKIKLVLAEEGL